MAWRCKQSGLGWVGLGILFLAGSAAGGVQAQKSAIGRSEDARRLISATADSLGTAPARRQAAVFRAEQAGTYFAGEQSADPTQAIAEAGRVYRWRFDPEAGAAIREAQQHFPGGITFWTRTAAGPAAIWSVDLGLWRTGTDLLQEGAERALKERLTWERFFAHLLVRQAEGANSADRMGADGFRYVDAAGTAVEVTVDPATARPVSATFPAPAGPPLEVRYSDYRRWGGVLFAGRMQLRQGGRLVEDLRLADVRADAIGEADMSPPQGYRSAPSAGAPIARQVSPGIFLFENMPGDYRSMAVDAGDHIVLLEAPLSAAYAQLQRRLLEEALPGKAVRAVLVTHHHGDHIGGLAFWAEAGATIMPPAGSRVAIERQLLARGYSGAVQIQEVNGRTRLGTRGREIDVHTFASSHAEAHLFVYLPGARTLFQGDLFYLPARGDPPPAFPIVDELDAQIARAGLRVEQIVGVHGRPASLEEFRASLRLGRAGAGRAE